MGGGRLKSRGKSKRSETPPDGHRSDSTGIVYQFPFQRSSGSVREALRLSRPPELRSAKIFSRLFRCPPPTHTTCPWPLSGFWARKVISFCRHVNFCVFRRRKRQFSIPIHRQLYRNVKSQNYLLPSTAPHSQNRARPPRDPAAHASTAAGGGFGGLAVWKCSACDYRRTRQGRMYDRTQSVNPFRLTAKKPLCVRRTSCPAVSECGVSTHSIQTSPRSRRPQPTRHAPPDPVADGRDSSPPTPKENRKG